MNIVIYIILLFICLNITFYFDLPNLTHKNYIYNKIILFGIIFLFNFIIHLINRLENKNMVTFKQIFRRSMLSSMYAIVSYSLVIDLTIMDNTKDIVAKYISDETTNIVITSSMISVFVLLMKLIEIMFVCGTDTCANDEST